MRNLHMITMSIGEMQSIGLGRKHAFFGVEM